MISLRYCFSFVAGALVATVLLAGPVVPVTTPAGESGLKERLLWWYDEYASGVGGRDGQRPGVAETEILEGDMREILPRIQFHTRFENRNPGGFFNEVSFFQLPDVVYFRSEYSGLKGGQRYLQKLYVYDPEGNRVKSGNDYEFTLDYSQTSWNTWYYWDGADIFTAPGDYRVESILVDRDANRYLVSSRDLTVGK